MKKDLKKKIWKFLFGISFLFSKVQRPGWKMSGFQTVWILKICWTSGPGVMSDRSLIVTLGK